MNTMNYSIIKPFFLLLVFFSINPSSHANTNSFLSCIYTKKTPNSIIYTANSRNYTSILQDHIRNGRFNTSETPKPALIFTPLDEFHVQDLVRCARETELHLRIRSGGHDYEGLSYTSKSPFAILDMFNLRSIEIYVDNATAWVGSGATLGELYYRIWEKSKELAFPAGVCPTLGLGGHFSGGGYGNLMRKYGLSVDNIVDARVVDAEGRILDRAAMGEDLFWAIRGGGGASFAVVVAFKINLVPVPAVVSIFDVSRNLEQNATGILHRWQYVAPKFEKELFVRVNLASVKNSGGATAAFLAMYLGGAEKLHSVVTAEFPELGVRKEDCKEMPWIEAVLYWAEFPAKTPVAALLERDPGPTTFKIKSDYVTAPVQASALEGLLRRIEAAGTSFFVKFNPYGGRMSEIPAAAAAFPHRAGNLYKIQYYHLWNETGAAAEAYHLKIVKDVYDYMTPLVSRNPRRAFLNYRDIDVGSSSESGANGFNEAKVYGVKYFGENYDRLVRVKTAVDPTDFFRYEQSIHPLPQTQLMADMF